MSENLIFRLDAQSEVSGSILNYRNQRWQEQELRQYSLQNIYSLNQKYSPVHFKGKSGTDHAMSTLLQAVALHRCYQVQDLGLEYSTIVKKGDSTSIHCCWTSYIQVV